MAVASIQLDVPLEGADDTTVCIFQRHIQLVLCHFPTTEKTLRPFGEYQRVRKQLLSQAIHSRRISAEGRRARLKTQSAYVIQADRRRSLEAVLTFKGKETDEAVFSENTESFGTAVHKSGAIARRLRCRNRISKVVFSWQFRWLVFGVIFLNMVIISVVERMWEYDEISNVTLMVERVALAFYTRYTVELGLRLLVKVELVFGGFSWTLF